MSDKQQSFYGFPPPAKTGFLDLVERLAAPATPHSGHWRLFFKSDGLYQLDDNGAESLVGAGGWPWSGKVITVDPTDPDADFSTIQAAHDDAGTGTGDAIVVGPATYTEQVTISKTLNILFLGGVTVTHSGTFTIKITGQNVRMISLGDATVTNTASSGIAAAVLVDGSGGGGAGNNFYARNIQANPAVSGTCEPHGWRVTTSTGVILENCEGQPTGGTLQKGLRTENSATVRVTRGRYNGATTDINWFSGAVTLEGPVLVNNLTGGSGTGTGFWYDGSGNLVVSNNIWQGLGAAKGRIIFVDTTLDEVQIRDATLVVGDGAAVTTAQIQAVNDGGNVFIDMTGYSGGASFRGLRAGGSRGSATAIGAGIPLLHLSGLGYNGTGFNSGSEIRFVTSETFSGSAAGSYLGLFTIDNGTLTQDERVRVNHDGKVGIGTTSPQGLLHGHDGVGGFLHWSHSAVAGSAITIIPNGTGDVVHRARIAFVVKPSTGSAVGGDTDLPNSTSSNLYNTGSDTLVITCNADGSVTVQRTAGTLTYALTLWILWL